MAGVANAVQIAVGWDGFAYALRSDGSVVCWGDNTWGALGRGLTKAQLLYDPTPAPVAF